MKKIKPYVLGILMAWTVVIMTACGTRGNGTANGTTGAGTTGNGTGAMTQTTQMESSSAGTTQSGGGKTGTAGAVTEETTGVINGVINDVRDNIDNGVGKVESGAVKEETSSSAAR